MTAVAIDGPAGAGKSSVARATARALGYRYLDTGAMYRAIALAAIEAGADVGEEAALARLIDALDLDVTEDHVLLNGRDVVGRIRDADVTDAAARIAQHQVVRDALVELQRRLASGEDVVMEGRDIGSEVLPDAEVKIYLTASLPERARRRCRQLGLPEGDDTCRTLQEDIARRDERDRNREVSPLLQAPDAIVIDTTQIDFPDVIQRVVELVRSATLRTTDR